MLEALLEVNRHVPVVVEGKRDAQALRRLGLVGEIITLHRGKGLYEFSEHLLQKHHRVVLLLDWDKTGEHLMGLLREHLRGHYEEFAPFRELLRILCQKDINDIEGIPALLKRLEGFQGQGS